jgi:hypothetical protein
MSGLGRLAGACAGAGAGCRCCVRLGPEVGSAVVGGRSSRQLLAVGSTAVHTAVHTVQDITAPLHRTALSASGGSGYMCLTSTSTARVCLVGSSWV